ncbi:MAG: glyoxalase [Chitinophagaceae bacterium]|nr:MAG: glyoxalase [Chitinophagaceae bacterium]
MKKRALSIRPFIGSKDFEVSRNFYAALGFAETVLWQGFSLFRMDECSFYLQDAHVQDWIDNTQVFVEVSDVHAFWEDLGKRQLPERFAGVRITAIRQQPWGSECFVHDPSGVLWHFGSFENQR